MIDENILLVFHEDVGLIYDWFMVIINAIFNDNTPTDNNPTCATGNCTFPTFSSLGFCSNCINVTNFVKKNSDCAYENALASVLLSCTYKFPPFPFNASIYISPADFHMTDGSFNTKFLKDWNDTQMYDAPSFLAFALADFSQSTEQWLKGFQTPFYSQNGESIPSSFGTYAFIKMNPLTGTQNIGFLETADICALSFCAREYNITVINGVFHSEILSTSYSKLTYNKSDDSDYDRPTFSSSYSFTFSNSNNNFDFVSGFLNFDDKYVLNNLETELHYALGSIFSGSSNITAFPGEGEELLVGSQSTSLVLDGLNASTDIPATMNNIALAMTKHLRETSDLVQEGQNMTTEIFVHVTWFWLILPVSSICSGALLLFFAIKNTRRNGMHVWKTSELALLFHGQGIPLNDPTAIYRVSEMEAIAARIQVKLGQGGQMNYFF